MPTQVAPVAGIVVDNPHALGLVQYLGYQHDFTFEPPKLGDAVGGPEDNFTYHNGTEYLAALKCVKPRGYVNWTDLEWATGDNRGWRVEWPDEGPTNRWRLTKPAIISPRTAFLDYFGSAPDVYGTVCNNQDLPPNLAVAAVRQASAPNTTAFGRYWAITFLGNDLHDDRKKFEFVFPLGDSTYKHPYLCMARHDFTGETVPRVAEWEAADIDATAEGPTVELYWFEMLDGYWVVRGQGVREPFVFRPELTDPVQAFGAGPVRIRCYGHAAMFYVQEITYPLVAQTYPGKYITADSGIWSTDRLYHCHSWTHPDTASDWQVQVTEDIDPTNADAWRLIVSFTGSGSLGADHWSPVCYVATMTAAAAQGGAVSAPDALTGEGIVAEVSYSINLTGRGQTCNALVRDTTAAKTWKGNEKTTVNVGWSYDGSADVTAQKFMGYIAAREGVRRIRDFKQYGSDLMLQLACADPVEARLSKKKMVMRTAAGGDYLANWVYELLWDAGVPAAHLTSIDAMCDAEPRIPQRLPKGDLAFKFGWEVCVIDALDDVTRSMGYEWGFDCETGLYFLRLPDSGTQTEDATISDDSAIWGLQHVKAAEDFRNYLVLLASIGGKETAAMWRDVASHRTSTDHAFIGDDWWEVMVESDLAEGGALAQRRWQELQKLPSLLTWTQKGDVALGPGKYVKFTVTRSGITSGDIYQIIEEQGRLVSGAGATWTQSFLARQWITS